MKLIFNTFLLLFLFASAKAQIAVGQWRDHLPYSHAHLLEEAADKIFCATEVSAFYYNKLDNSLNRISKITGLSDVSITAMKYHKELKMMILAYETGNLDLITESGIFNLSDIKRENIIGSKKINHILLLDRKAYLSCGFGVVVLNLEKQEIAENYYMAENGAQIEVFAMAYNSDENLLYAATEQGVYYASFSSPNLVDFHNWSKIKTLPNTEGRFTEIAFFNGKIYVLSQLENESNCIYFSDGNTWQILENNLPFVYALRVSDNKLLVSAQSQLNIYNADNQLVESIIHMNESNNNPRDAMYDAAGDLWIADHDFGLVKRNNSDNFAGMHPTGPYNNDAEDLAIADDNLWVAAGGKTSYWSNIYKNCTAYSFIDGEWNSQILYETDARDLITIAVNPQNTAQVFAGSLGGGVFEFQNKEWVNTYDQSNSSLQNIGAQSAGNIRIGGLAFDEEANLWVCNYDTPQPLSVRQTDGTWQSFAVQETVNWHTMGQIIVTQNDYKWVVLPRGGGLFAFDHNRTISNTADDRSRKFSVKDENGTLISNQIYALAEDKNGEIWVGTEHGIAVYYSPQQVFDDNNFYAHRVIIEIDGKASYLLGTETVTAITVDGANRKWCATKNSGVFLFSSDGTELLEQFNTTNSPLISNNVKDIAISENTGEVFFATDKGIVSYRGTASEAKANFQNVYAYPNPVRPNYQGDIVITGLIENTQLKITDISGNLVFETYSLGGQAIWNGKNLSGERVHTGVYLIFCSDQEGEQTFVSKLLFIN